MASVCVKPLLVGVARTKSVSDELKHIGVELEPFEHFSESRFEVFFAHVGLWAPPLVAAAPVVDVLCLLDFADERAAAVAAGNEVAEGEVVFYLAVLVGLTAVQDGLYLIPQLA